MKDKLDVCRLIQARANRLQLEFKLTERGSKWFVYGFDISSCSSRPNGTMQTTWMFIQPPDTIYRKWHWNTCGDVRAPMNKERELADYICRLFDRWGSTCSCACDSDKFICNNNETRWDER